MDPDDLQQVSQQGQARTDGRPHFLRLLQLAEDVPFGWQYQLDLEGVCGALKLLHPGHSLRQRPDHLLHPGQLLPLPPDAAVDHQDHGVHQVQVLLGGSGALWDPLTDPVFFSLVPHRLQSSAPDLLHQDDHVLVCLQHRGGAVVEAPSGLQGRTQEGALQPCGAVAPGDAGRRT